MENPQERLKEILGKLRERQFRITPQRVAILNILLNSTNHPTVDQIYEQVLVNFPTTSLATVYKTVNLLKEIGEICVIAIPDGSNRYDGRNVEPHPHVICEECKTITDLESGMLDRLMEEVSGISGYQISSHQIDFMGLCPSCQVAQKKQNVD